MQRPAFDTFYRYDDLTRLLHEYAQAYPDLVRVERKLVGAEQVAFETIRLMPGEDQCAQVRDMIAPGTLGQGHFSYEVHLMTDGGEIASAVRQFEAVRGTQGSRPGS